MTKIVKNILTIILLSVLASGFGVTNLMSFQYVDTGSKAEVENLIKRFETPVLSEIANDLIKMATSEDREGDFFNSVKHFRQAIYLRQAIGLLNKDVQTANLFFLTSLSEYHFEDYCAAKEHAYEAYKIYSTINNQTYILLIKNELESMETMCENSPNFY